MPQNHQRDLVFAYRTIFADIYRSDGLKKLSEYAREIYTQPTASDARIIHAVAQVTEKILGTNVSNTVRASLQKNNYVSTVDHHGPLSHAAFFQPHLLRMVLDTEKEIPATIVLSCASVSLDNHTFPRGFYFFNDYGERVRLPFFSLHDRHVSVYGQRPFTQTDATRNMISREQRTEIYDVLGEVLQNSELYMFENYRSQISFMNHKVMKKIYPEGGDFVSLAIEDVVRELFCSGYLEEDLFVASILFNPRIRTRFLQETNGIQTSHDFARKDTTVFFWGQREGIRVPLRVTGEYLTNDTKGIQIHLDVQSIQDALRDELIFPNLALCLIVLSSRGMNLGGGFFQVDYLPSLIEHAKKVIADCGLDEIQWGRGNYLGGDYTYMPQFNSHDVTALDIVKNPPCAEDVTYYAHTVSIHEAIDRIIPDVYHILDSRLRSEWEHIVMNTTDLQ